MCDDHDVSAASLAAFRVDRRTALQFAAGFALMPEVLRPVRPPSARAVVTPLGIKTTDSTTNRYTIAGHLHSSFDELDGSMAGHALNADFLGLDGLAFSSHSQRVLGIAPLTWEFTVLQRGKNWIWTPFSNKPAGATTTGSSGLGTLADGTTGLVIKIDSSAQASYGINALDQHDQTGNVAGRRFIIPNLSVQLDGATLVVRMVFSSHFGLDNPKSKGTPIEIEWRFKNTLTSSDVSGKISESKAVIYKTIPNGTSSIELKPEFDIPTYFPKPILVARDNSIWGVEVRLDTPPSGGRGSFAVARFDYPRDITGDDAFNVFNQTANEVMAGYPSLTRIDAIEQSQDDDGRKIRHIHWIGPNARAVVNAHSPFDVVQQIFAADGHPVLNHLSGISEQAVTTSDADQKALADDIYNTVIKAGCWGTDAMELYRIRGGLSRKWFEYLWWKFLRAGVYMTRVMASDDHSSSRKGWTKGNIEVTSYGAATLTSEGIRDALRRGNTVTQDPVLFKKGFFDVTLDGYNIGDILVNPSATTRTVTIYGENIPKNSVVRVMRGLIGYEGVNSPDPQIEQVFGDFSASSLSRAGTSYPFGRRSGDWSVWVELWQGTNQLATTSSITDVRSLRNKPLPGRLVAAA